MIRSRLIVVVSLLVAVLATSCNTLRYVPEGQSLLHKNRVKLIEPKGANISKSDIEQYIQQAPNRRLLGMGIYLGFYNITDSSKHNGWHKFWGEKIGEAPVILDSILVTRSVDEIEIFAESKGFLNAEVSDTIVVNNRRKSTVTYRVNTHEPFVIADVKYNIEDNFLKPIIESDTLNSLLRTGKRFERSALEGERVRVSNRLRNIGFWGFNQTYISYAADSTLGNNTVNLTINVSQFIAGQSPKGENIYVNHPIYRIKNIVLNSNYDPSISVEEQSKVHYDTIEYRDVDILYRDKLLLKENILLNQLGMSPGELFSQQNIEQTYTNIRSLDLNPSIIFTPLPVDTSNLVYVTDATGSAMTTERELNCLIQCIPNVRQNFSLGFEASTTADYYSLALKFGYQNRNLFKGAEDFNISLRGAYEFLKSQQQKNSFEFGIATSISFPRFWLPISPDKMREFSYSSTTLSLSYSIQRRPFYERSIFSAVYGYGWTLKNGARFTINPVDVHVVDVPWVDSMFLWDIENPYLRNSYSSQLIAGLSASYSYNTNPDIKQNGFTFNVMADLNGNLLYGLNELFGSPKIISSAGDNYYNLFGLRFAQYFRVMADVSNRVNVGKRTQIAWRFLAAGGYAYGNSQSLPFERMLFAGGANSMRGWQVRTLGPGGTLILDYGSYPNQLGDLRLEANLEFRFNIVGGLNTALFFDCGNIWMNGKGETRPDAKFLVYDFYKQLGFNTGVGLRYDLGFFVFRLDWGLKLHNPNNSIGQRWFRDLTLDKTALHFAIGLPF